MFPSGLPAIGERAEVVEKAPVAGHGIRPGHCNGGGKCGRGFAVPVEDMGIRPGKTVELLNNEGTGDMARAACVMDRAMHSMGLHGKSFIPMLMGFGRNVPAIYATRTLENPRDKALTALPIPLMSCGARLPVYVLFTGAFFPAHAGMVHWSLHVMEIVLAVLVGILFKRTLFRGESPLFIMELPPCRMPSGRSLMIHTWEKGKHFLVKAGTYILAVSVLVWFLLNLPWGVENKKDSFLGKTGSAIAPVFAPLGFGNWEASPSLIAGVIAKEIVVGTMGEIYVKGTGKKPGGPAPAFTGELRGDRDLIRGGR